MPKPTDSFRPRGLQRIKAAEYIGVSPRLFDDIVKVERIPVIHVPGRRRNIFDVPDLDRVIDKWKAAGGKKP